MKNNKTATKLQGNKVANEKATKVSANTVKQTSANTDKKEKVTYLAENVTGKQLQAAKIESNKDNRDELQSLSFCIAQFKKHGQKVINCFKGLTFDEITPKNILPHLTEAEKTRLSKNENKFTYWLIEALVIRYAKSKK
jgi:hypothetical protein